MDWAASPHEAAPSTSVSPNGVVSSVRDAPKKAHMAMKAGFQNAVGDPSTSTAGTRSDELPQTAATGLFLVLLSGKWKTFPRTMKALWILCILLGAVIQWSSTWLLFLYLNREPDPEDESD